MLVQVTKSAHELNAAAEEMSKVADSTSLQSATVSSAATQADANVQTVAAAQVQGTATLLIQQSELLARDVGDFLKAILNAGQPASQ